VRFHPTGKWYLSVGMDSRILLMDSNDGKKLKSFHEDKEAHKSAIMGVAWSGDGAKFVTASLDKTCKLWSFDSKDLSASVTKTFTFAKKALVGDQQVGIVWAGDQFVSLSLSGALNYLDEKTPDKPRLVVQGHAKAERGFGQDRAGGLLYTTDDDGVLGRWTLNANKMGAMDYFEGCSRSFEGGKPIVACAPTCDGKKLVTVGYDDVYRFHDTKTLQFQKTAVGLGGQPSVLAVAKKDANLAVAVLTKGLLVVFREAKVLSSTKLDYTPICVAINHNDSELAVGSTDAKVRTYSFDGEGKVAALKTLHPGHLGRVLAVAYSPDGGRIAATDSNRQIIIWQDGVQKNDTAWMFHGSGPNDVNWSADGSRLVTCGLDQDIIVWTDLKKYEHEYQRITTAHSGGADHVAFWDDKHLVSSGADRAIRIWVGK